jgi:hypothetical protein
MRGLPSAIFGLAYPEGSSEAKRGEKNRELDERRSTSETIEAGEGYENR